MTPGRPPKVWPFGRLEELRSRPDADRIGCTPNPADWGTVLLRTYASREALLTFCPAGGKQTALVRDAVHPTVLTNPNTQRVDPSAAVPKAAGGAS